jgi:hypothetical protein
MSKRLQRTAYDKLDEAAIFTANTLSDGEL